MKAPDYLQSPFTTSPDFEGGTDINDSGGSFLCNVTAETDAEIVRGILALPVMADILSDWLEAAVCVSVGTTAVTDGSCDCWACEYARKTKATLLAAGFTEEEQG